MTITTTAIIEEVLESYRSIDLDRDLFKFFQIGLVLGICIVTGLVLFPGTPPPPTRTTSDYVVGDSTKDDEPPARRQQATKNEEQINSTGKKASQQQPRVVPSTNRDDDDDDESLDVSLREQERRLYRRILEQRRRGRGGGEGGGSWTPHQQMNFVVYVIIIGVALFVLGYTYDDKRGFWKHWLAHHFPREASVFGWVAKETMIATNPPMMMHNEC